MLKLDTVAEDRKRFGCGHSKQFAFSCDGQRRKKSDGVANEVVKVETFQFEGCLCQEAPHPPDDFAGASVILQNIFHDIVEFSDVRIRRLQDRLCRFGVGEDSPKRLVNFMGN